MAISSLECLAPAMTAREDGALVTDRVRIDGATGKYSVTKITLRLVTL